MDKAVKSSIMRAYYRSEGAQQVQEILKSLEGEPGYVEYCKFAMFEACRVGNVGILEYLVRESRSVDSLVISTNENGETPLHIASKQLNVEVCKVIIQITACKLNIPSIIGQTPLHLAVQAEDDKFDSKVEIIKLLLAIPDCDPNIRDAEGDTPLIAACKLVSCQPQAYLKIINALLSSSCDPCIQNNVGDTALHIAAAGSSQDAVEVLVYTKNCELNLVNKDGEVPLHIACKNLQIEAVKLFLENGKSNINVQTTTGQTPLHLAVGADGKLESKLEIVQLLLATPDCDPNMQNSDGDTPLIVACHQVNVNTLIINTLICSEKCDPNIRNYGGNAALHLAVFRNSQIAIQALVRCKGYKPDLPNRPYVTPLHIACSELNKQAVAVLLKEGRCNVNAQTSTGQTPLHLAISAKAQSQPKLKGSVVRLLLEVPDCDPHIADAQGVTPLQTVYDVCADAQIFVQLLEKGCDEGYSKRESMMEQAMILMNDNLLFLIARKSKSRILPFMMSINPHTINNIVAGSGPSLISAVREQDAETVEMLLDFQCCDPNVRNANGDTPLIISCKMANMQIIYALLHHKKCDVSAQNNDGNTALHFAVAICQNIVKSITFHEKYIPNLANKLGETPLHTACLQLNVKAVQVLLKEGKCDVNAQTNIGQTPLHYAITAKEASQPVLKDITICLLLNVPDCDPHIANVQGATPLQTAYKVCAEPPIFILRLLEKGCEEGYSKSKSMIEQAMSLLDYNLLRLIARRSKSKILPFMLFFDPHTANNGVVPSRGDPLLISAVRADDAETVEMLLEFQHCDPNVRNAHGETSLMIACIRKNVWIINALLRCEKCDVSAQNHDGNTALHFAAATCQDVVKPIIFHDKYKPNLPNVYGKTPLHTACKYLSIESVTVLLKEGRCDVNVQTNTGRTPLHLALVTDIKRTSNPMMKETVIHLLLEVPNCDPHIADAQGVTPLQTAHKLCDDSQIVISLLEKGCEEGYSKRESMIEQAMTLMDDILLCNIACKSKSKILPFMLSYNPHTINNGVASSRGDPLLISAVRANDTETVEMLLEHQLCDPNVRNAHGETPLMIACKRANVWIFNALLRCEKCDVSAQKHDGNTALHYAAATCQDAVKPIIFHVKYKPNISNKLGETPLHIACFQLNTPTATVLLKEGRCDVNAQTNTGQTPLHLVLTAKPNSKQKDIICLLLQLPHCDLHIADTQGETPLQIAYNTNILIFTLILEKGCAQGYLLTKKVIDEALALTNGYLLHLLIHFGANTIMRNIIKSQGSPAVVNKVEESSGDTPLIAAIKTERVEAVKVLLESQYCDCNLKTASNGDTPLIVACKRVASHHTEGYFQIIHLLLSNDSCDINCQNVEGNTALHIAAAESCQVALAAVVGHERHKPNLVNARSSCGEATSNSTTQDTVLFNQQCDPNIRNSCGETPLHVDVEGDNSDIFTALLFHVQCDPSIQNNSGETPLHIACELWKYEYVVALTRSQQCNINIPDNNGHTALHKAIYNMKQDDLSIIEHLISDSRCDVTACDLQGNTALHIACTKAAWRHDESIAALIRMLLSTGKVDPQCVNNAGETPIQLAVSNEQIVQELSSFSTAQLDHPVQTFVKMFVIGNAETGKSTLVESVRTDASWSRRFVPAQFKTVKRVKPHTAGIVPVPVNNRHFGNAVIYDFAGQHEYYSSHAAVLENLVLSSPPVFLLTFNLSESFDHICKTVAYWWSFICSYTTKSSSPPHVIMVGSHKDVVKSRGEKVHLILDRLLSTMKEVPTNFTLVDGVTLDCRVIASEGLTNLLSMLKHTCETVRRDVKIDLRCHILSSFLSDTLPNRMACTLAEIIDSVKAEESTLLPQSTSDLVNLLAALSDKDRILLLKNTEHLERSWIILQRQKIFGDINGSIFAPEYFDEYVTDFAGNTGIVPVSKLKTHFPQYPPDVITGFLSHLQFCFKIGDAQTLELITTEVKDFGPNEEFYFFPALVSRDNPPEENVWDTSTTNSQLRKRYGWFYECAHRYQYLMCRFLHVLILRIAFSYALAMEHEQSHTLPVVRRRCSVWKRGIAWRNNDGIETVVEVGLQNQWVVVFMQCPVGMEVECTELRRSVIKTVLDAKQEFCPDVAMNEYLMHPGITDYPFKRTKQLALYSMKEVCKVMIEGKKYVVDKGGLHQSALVELLPCEPYIGLGKQLITQLFVPECAQKVMTGPIFSEIAQGMLHSNPDVSQQKLKLLASELFPLTEPFFLPDDTSECVLKCTHLLQQVKPITFQNLREVMSKFSILCGRDPWDLSGLSPATDLLEARFNESEFQQYLEKTDDSLLGIESLLVVRTEVVPAVGHSASLGQALGLSQTPTLQVIQHNWPDDVTFQLTEIMAAWLQGKENSSWRSLAKAMLDPAVDCPAIAHAIMEHHPHQRHCSDPNEDDLTYQEVNGAAPDESFVSDVHSAVVQGSHFSWFHLGLVLGLHYDTLKAIPTERTGQKECVAAVILKWLNQVDSVKRRGQPSWRVLARALAHPLVGQHRLADEVAREHPAQEGTSTSVTVSQPEIADTSAESSSQSLHPLPPSPPPAHSPPSSLSSSSH